MSRIMNRSLYLLVLFSPLYGWVPVPETSSEVPLPLQPPVGGVGGLQKVDQLKVAGLPFGSRIRSVLAPSPESNSVTRIVLPACTGSICAR